MLTLEYPGVPEFCQVVPDNGGDGFIVDLVHCNPQSGDEGNYPVNIILTDDGTPPQSGFVVINIEVLDGTTQKVAATYTHGRPKWAAFYNSDEVAAQKQFFDHFLKGIDNGMDAVPAVRLEVRERIDQYAVRYENEWPIARTEYRPLYLDAASGQLRDTPPAGQAVVTYEPLSESATFVITFDVDTELTGNMKLRLWISTTQGSDMDLFVGVKKLDTQGEEVTFNAKTGYTLGPVAMGWLRVSERALDEARSTPWQPYLSHDNPQPIVAGEIVPVDVEILPSSTLFRAGESLELVVQGRDLFEHPSLAHGYSDEVNVGAHSIHTGPAYDSHLLVPVIPVE